jgi:hypothetical protein
MSRVPILAPDVTVIVPEMELLPVFVVTGSAPEGAEPTAAAPVSRYESVAADKGVAVSRPYVPVMMIGLP